jgi:ribonuclease HII
VVAAAVILPRACVAEQAGRPWPALGVRIDDSKRLSPAQRQQAFPIILQHATVGVGIVDAEAIDTLNIHQATLAAMAQALEALTDHPDVVLVDGLHAPRADAPCRTIVDGDRLSYSIACASIVAKVIRDDLMRFYHRLFPEYGFDQHKGYGTPLHAQGLKAAGPCWLHRRSFQPVWEAESVADPLPH